MFTVSDPPYGIREPAAKVGSNKAEVEAIPEEYQGKDFRLVGYVSKNTYSRVTNKRKV